MPDHERREASKRPYYATHNSASICAPINIRARDGPAAVQFRIVDEGTRSDRRERTPIIIPPNDKSPICTYSAIVKTFVAEDTVDKKQKSWS